jgi:hypothetical protein
VYSCICGRPVFFRNSICLGCHKPLGYEPSLGSIFALEEGAEPGIWHLLGAGGGERRSYRQCGNIASPSGCNWLTEPDDPTGLCLSCRLDRTIPNLENRSHGESWRRIEVAKRQLVSSLLLLGLPVVPKAQDSAAGLAFDFLSDDGSGVMTGHEDGIITLNIAEADDVTREGIREQLHEPYRTVLGHLRHEVGHYYWDRLVRDSHWLEGFRELFGDERADYAEALQTHYRQGPPPDWQERFVSAYASSHPWEDWAETWAHYLHIGDTLSTAASFGLNVDTVDMTIEPFGDEDLCCPDAAYLNFANSWIRFTAVLNELSRSMGLQDFYPFVLSKSSIRKLHFVHRVVFAPRAIPELPTDRT